jgi:Putative DNA-binding domain
MNVALLQRMLAQGDLSPAALKILIRSKAECEWLDFKVRLDLAHDKQLCDFAKDVLAMRNTGGGYIVIGVQDVTWEPVGMDKPLALDSKQLRDKLRKALGVRLDVLLVNHQANVKGVRRWFAIILVPVPSTSENFPELEFVARDYRANEKYGLTAGLTYARSGDETINVRTGRQFEIARLKLGKAVSEANYTRNIDRLSQSVGISSTALSDIVEGSWSVVEIGDDIAVFSEEPERRQVLSASRADSPALRNDPYLREVEAQLWRIIDMPLAQLAQVSTGSLVTMGGRLAEVYSLSSSLETPTLAATIYDSTGEAHCIFPPAVYVQYKELLTEGVILVVRARVDRQQEQAVLHVLEARIPYLGGDTPTPVVLNVDARQMSEGVVNRLKEILRSHRGSSPVHLQIRGAQKTMIIRLSDELRVDPEERSLCCTKGSPWRPRPVEWWK